MFCFDLLERGIINKEDNKEDVNVHVVADCVSSQQGYDREIALRRMENAGAFITTAQSLAFMLMESKFFVKCLYVFYVVVS